MIIENIGIDTPELDSEFIREILAVAKPIKDFVWEIERHSTTRALRGEEFEGFKLVEGGRAPFRSWGAKEGNLVKVLDNKVAKGDVREGEVYDARKPVSPAKLEKVLGKEFVDKYSSRPAYDRPTILVPESDKRKQIKRATDEFADFMDGDDVDLDDFDI